MAAFIYGAIHTGLFGRPTLTLTALQRLAGASGLWWIAMLVAVRLFGRDRSPVIVLGLLVSVAAAAQFAATVTVLFVFASAWCIGSAAFGRFALRSSELLAFVVRVAAGLALISWSISVAALIPIANPATYFAGLAVPILLQWRVLPARLRTLVPRWSAATRLETALLGAVGNAVLVAMLLALMPEVGNDALHQHLGVLSDLREFGYWHYDVGRTILAVVPLAGDFVYAAPYMLAGEFAAKLANFACYALLLVLIFAWARTTASRGIALVSVLIMATIPLALLETCSLFIENPWALFIVSSVAVLAHAVDDDGNPTGIYVSAVLLGAAAAAKMMALALAPVLLIAAGFALRGPDRWRHLAWACCLGSIVALPPYLIALVKTGSPTFPFFNDIFHSPLFFPVQVITAFPPTVNPLALYRATFYSDLFLESYPGAIGFVPLLVFPMVVFALLFGGQRRGRVLVASMVVLAVAVFANMAYLRYIYPVFAMMAMGWGSAIGIMRSRDQSIAFVACLIAMSGVLASVPWLTAAAPQLRDLPFHAAFSDRARDQYVDTWAPHRRLVDRINLEPPGTGAVAFTGAPFTAGLKRPAYVRSLLNPSFANEISASTSPEQVLKSLASRDIGYVVVDGSTPPSLASMIQGLGTLLVDGPVRLYAIDDRLLLSREVLRDTIPSPTSRDWFMQGAPTVDADGSVVVTTADYVGTRAAVSGGSRYRVEVRSRCEDGESVLRAQVTWFDGAESGLGVVAKDSPCTKGWSTLSTALLAPRGAASAVLYVLAVKPSPVAVATVSLRGR